MREQEKEGKEEPDVNKGKPLARRPAAKKPSQADQRLWDSKGSRNIGGREGGEEFSQLTLAIRSHERMLTDTLSVVADRMSHAIACHLAFRLRLTTGERITL